MNPGLDASPDVGSRMADALRVLAEALGMPTHLLLLSCVALCLFEVGVFAQERLGRPHGDPAKVMALARRRVERVDVLARVGPMLGLMGTLIPLGPGLSALGQGDVAALASAVTVAFDTTVVGLALGIVAFCLARGRRHYYDRLFDALESEGDALRAASDASAAWPSTAFDPADEAPP